jgi:hypothetical protein
MTTPDLRTVDELCRLAVAARRLDCRIHLAGAGPDLRALLDVAGVGEVLGKCPAVDQPHCPSEIREDLR